MTNIVVLRSDERQESLCDELRKKGYLVRLLKENCDFFREINNCDAVVLPIPSLKNGMINPLFSTAEKFIEYIDKDITVFSSCTFGTDFQNKLERKGIKVFDYYEREELKTANAYATAQGVLEILLSEIKTLCRENRIIISGFGHTGKAICRVLKRNGFEIDVLVRNRKYFYEIKEEGAVPYMYGETEKKEYSYLINTVCAKVIDEKILRKIGDNCKIIEIASAPYGIDFEYAEKAGLQVKTLPSLPGKTVPVSAGKFIARTVDNIIKEENL